MSWDFAANLADVIAIPVALGLFGWAEWRLLQERREANEGRRRVQADKVAAWMDWTEKQVAFSVRNGSDLPIRDVEFRLPNEVLGWQHDNRPADLMQTMFKDQIVYRYLVLPPGSTRTIVAIATGDPRTAFESWNVVQFRDVADRFWYRDSYGRLHEEMLFSEMDG